MSGPPDDLRATPALPRGGSRPLPATRSAGWLALLLPLPVAAVAGLGAGLDPDLTLTLGAAVVSAAVLVSRVEWAALAVVAGAVFEDYLRHVSPWALEWLVAVLLVAWVVRRAEGRLHPHPLRRTALSVAALVAAVGLALAVHPHGREGLDVAASYAGLAVVALVLADVLSGPLPPRRAARVYVLACVVASVCGLLTAAVSDRHVAAGPVESSDTLAFFLLAAVPLAGTVRARPRHPAWWTWACFTILLLGIVGTQSRVAFVALLAMLLAAVVTGRLTLRHAGGLLAVAATGVALYVAVLQVPLGQALTDPQRDADTTTSQRLDLRLTALDMARVSPVVGLGPGAFALLHQDYRAADADPDLGGVETAYSTLLEGAADLGALGALALYAVWSLPVAAARRRWLADRSALTGAVLLALDGLLVASLLESGQHVLPLWFLAALAVARGHAPPGRTPVFGGGPRVEPSGQVPPGS